MLFVQAEPWSVLEMPDSFALGKQAKRLVQVPKQVKPGCLTRITGREIALLYHVIEAWLQTAGLAVSNTCSFSHIPDLEYHKSEHQCPLHSSAL